MKLTKSELKEMVKNALSEQLEVGKDHIDPETLQSVEDMVKYLHLSIKNTKAGKPFPGSGEGLSDLEDKLVEWINEYGVGLSPTQVSKGLEED